MTKDDQTEVDSILEQFGRDIITALQRDQAIEAVAARGRSRRRITEIVDNDCA